MEVGSGVKNFKAGDKVVSVLSHLVGSYIQDIAIRVVAVTLNTA